MVSKKTGESVDPGDIDVLGKDPTLRDPFLTDVLASLVRTPSVNPGTSEQSMATRVAEWLKDTPAEVTFVEFAPGRPSVGAVLEGSGSGPRLVLNGHADTVPIDDAQRWTTDPFGAEVKDGFLYGRGACDMKAGLTVQIAVAHYLSRHIDRLKGSLVLHFAAGEERAEPGTLSLLQAGFVGDLGIVTEPTELKVATAERGVAHYKIRIDGRSIHASRAHLGVNPDLEPAPCARCTRGLRKRGQAAHARAPSARHLHADDSPGRREGECSSRLLRTHTGSPTLARRDR